MELRAFSGDSFARVAPTVMRSAPVVASLAVHVLLVSVVAVVVPRATARFLDAIPVELVAIEPARAPVVVDAPPPAAREAKLTLPKPIATPMPKVAPITKREPIPEPPARELAPVPTPPAATPEPAPVVSAPAAPPSAPAVTAPSMTASAGTAPIGPGVSLVESAPTTRPTSTVASIPPGVTRVAHPRGGYQVQPRYPSTAQRLGIQGTTLLRIHVLADGRIGDVNVETSAGHPDLDRAAADAVRRWRFEPARRGDEPVAMWVELPVEFRLK